MAQGNEVKIIEQTESVSRKHDFLISNNLPSRLSAKLWTYKLFRWQSKDSYASIDGIHQDGMLDLINQFGYWKRYKGDNSIQNVLVKNNIIEEVSIANIKDTIHNHIKSATDIDTDHKSVNFRSLANQQMEVFLRNSNSFFCDVKLHHLPNYEKPILKDTVNEAFFAFQNCIIKVTKKGVSKLEFSELEDTCIWKDHLIKRKCDIKDVNKVSIYSRFINNVCNGEKDRINAFRSAIGYLLHNYSKPTSVKAIIAYDEQIADKNTPSGGSGKGVFNLALKELRNAAIIDGKKVNDKNQFAFQLVNERSQIISFDDVKPDFDFHQLNSNLTTGWQIEHKNKPSFRFEQSENPKTYITSNTILKADGTTFERRAFVIEFSSYYSELFRQGKDPIIDIHGGMFFSDDWDKKEWNSFYSFMFDCVSYYLENGLQNYELRSVNKNKLLQQTSDDFVQWSDEKDLQYETEYNVQKLFDEFKDQYYGSDSDFKRRTFTNWLKKKALIDRNEFHSKRSNNITLIKFSNIST